MKKILFGSAMAILMALTLGSCSDPDASTLLTDGTWKFKDATTDSEDQDIKTLILLYKALLIDGTMNFQGDGTFIMTAPLMEEPQTGSWSLIGDDQLVLTREGEPPQTANINELSEEKLKYVETYVDAEGGVYSLTTTWTR
jgi:hypothetical protein